MEVGLRPTARPDRAQEEPIAPAAGELLLPAAAGGAVDGRVEAERSAAGADRREDLAARHSWEEGLRSWQKGQKVRGLDGKEGPAACDHGELAVA